MTQSESQRVDIPRTTPETSANADRLSVEEQRIPSRRGLVPLHNQSGKPLPVTDVRRLIRLNRAVFKTEKIDLLAHGPIPNRWRDVFDDEDALDAGLDVRLSWRTDCSAPPDSLGELRDAGLFDVFLTPRSLGAGLDAWLAACLELRAPVRAQVQPPFAEDLDAATFADRLAKYEVRVLNVTLNDPFLPHSHSARSGESQRTLSQMNALVKAANARDIEANLIGTPLCLVDEQNLPCAQNDLQFFLDHQQYRRESYEFARQVYPLPPFITSAVIALTLGRHTYRETNIDNRLLRWLIEKHPVWHACAASFHKATRALRIANKPARPTADTQEAYDDAIKALDREETARLGPECSRCSLRRICGHETPTFKRALPGIPVRAVTGELCVSPMHFAKSQRKYYDARDEPRRRISETQKALAKQANEALNTPPDLQFGFDHYGVENGYYMQLPGAITWFSITKEEKRSTLIASLQAPFTVAVTFGGGIADYIGFSLGRHAKILCPMEAYSHRLALHVDASGNYVLLRDGALMRPVEFDGAQYAPAKAPTVAP
ncbi:MAG: hypothetical protein HZB26_18810, partial [Candidatus Hydrogenedentes bacterium]|nr:hypothetical protein [Candidatus Hydrogenedentota bacterium]